MAHDLSIHQSIINRCESIEELFGRLNPEKLTPADYEKVVVSYANLIRNLSEEAERPTDRDQVLATASILSLQIQNPRMNDLFWSRCQTISPENVLSQNVVRLTVQKTQSEHLQERFQRPHPISSFHQNDHSQTALISLPATFNTTEELCLHIQNKLENIQPNTPHLRRLFSVHFDFLLKHAKPDGSDNEIIHTTIVNLLKNVKIRRNQRYIIEEISLLTRSQRSFLLKLLKNEPNTSLKLTPSHPCNLIDDIPLLESLNSDLFAALIEPFLQPDERIRLHALNKNFRQHGLNMSTTLPQLAFKQIRGPYEQDRMVYPIEDLKLRGILLNPKPIRDGSLLPVRYCNVFLYTDDYLTKAKQVKLGETSTSLTTYRRLINSRTSKITALFGMLGVLPVLGALQFKSARAKVEKTIYDEKVKKFQAMHQKRLAEIIPWLEKTKQVANGNGGFNDVPQIIAASIHKNYDNPLLLVSEASRFVSVSPNEMQIDFERLTPLIRKSPRKFLIAISIILDIPVKNLYEHLIQDKELPSFFRSVYGNSQNFETFLTKHPKIAPALKEILLTNNEILPKNLRHYFIIRFLNNYFSTERTLDKDEFLVRTREIYRIQPPAAQPLQNHADDENSDSDSSSSGSASSDNSDSNLDSSDESSNFSSSDSD